MIYAPVIIPTLNRKNHLQRCLESLKNNPWSEQTEIYVSVDFPPSEKYVDGYNEVKEYLSSADFSQFKKFNVFYQKENLGASKNGEFLINEISKTYDRYIFSEDDNEFSSNFLEYVNKGLDLYCDDCKIMAICASKDTDWKFGNSNFALSKLYAAYGVGSWIAKNSFFYENIKSLLLNKTTYSLKNMQKLYKKNRFLFFAYITNILCADNGTFWNKDGSLRICDTVRSIYMHFTDVTCVVPRTNKARTWGNDGTGENMPLNNQDPRITHPLDTDLHFEFTDTESTCYFTENDKMAESYLCSTIKHSIIKAVIMYIILLLCKKDRIRAINIIKKLKKPFELFRRIYEHTY